MSHAAFLSAIREHPDADLPRLVYADWLEENGDPIRAEFIRLQCELATLPEHHPLARILEDREHELLSAHEKAWWGFNPYYLTGDPGLPSEVRTRQAEESFRIFNEWQWRRGFLHELSGEFIRLCESDAIADLHAVTKVTCLNDRSMNPSSTQLLLSRSIEINSYPLALLKSQWIQQVRSLSVSMIARGYFGIRRFLNSVEPPHLTALELSNTEYPNDTDTPTLAEVIRLFQGRKFTTRLESLKLDGLSSQLFAVSDGQVQRFANALAEAPLKVLSLPDSSLDADGVEILLTSPFADTLTSLDISGNPLAPDAYECFARARPALRLQSLDVSGTPLAGISLGSLLNLPATESLTELQMNGCGSARSNMEILSRSPFWSQATRFRAHSGTIPASTLEPLCKSTGPKSLRLLDLADNYVRTEGVQLLCDSPWTHSLTWLALSRNYLDDYACRTLANSELRHLRTLHLAHNNPSLEGYDGEVITDWGVRRLCDSPTLANLRLLTLSYTGITYRSVDMVLNQAIWRLFGLGIAGNELDGRTVQILAKSRNLQRLSWLDLSGNPELGGAVLMPLAESPYLSPLCDLDCGGIAVDDRVLGLFRERLGPRFTY